MPSLMSNSPLLATKSLVHPKTKLLSYGPTIQKETQLLLKLIMLQFAPLTIHMTDICC